VSILWILARSTGLIATVLLSAVMVLGILSSGDFRSRPWSRYLTNGMHRRVAYLACAMLGIHIAAIVADSYVSVDLLNVVVPFSSSYERFAVGLAAISIDLMLVLVITSLGRRFISFNIWQTVHVVAYAVWPLAILHGILAGTDDLLAWSISLISTLAVATVALVRFFGQSKKPTRRPAVAAPAAACPPAPPLHQQDRPTQVLTPQR